MCPDSTLINHKFHELIFNKQPAIPTQEELLQNDNDPPIPDIPILIDCS